MSEGEYFSEESMKIRNPSLYYQYVGKYKEEPDQMKEYDEKETLSGRLLQNMDVWDVQDAIENAKATEEEEEESSDEEEEDDESSSEEDDEEEEMKTDSTADTTKKDSKENGTSKKDKAAKREEERADMEEFLTVMKARFMDGHDTDFTDYSTIDNDAELDDIREMSREAEEKYFDED
jgi:hypothetical protein